MERKLNTILALPRHFERTAALARWLQGLYADGEDRPVLTGGAALELFTAGGYVTEDLDLAGTVPEDVAGILSGNGFVQLGRHWIHQEERFSLIFCGEALRDGEEAVVRVFRDHPVLVVSPEDLLVDRLSTWRHCESPVHGVQAYLLYQAAQGPMDPSRLRIRAMEEDVESALESVVRLFFKSGGRLPAAGLLGAWASREI